MLELPQCCYESEGSPGKSRQLQSGEDFLDEVEYGNSI